MLIKLAELQLRIGHTLTLTLTDIIGGIELQEQLIIFIYLFVFIITGHESI